MFIYKENNPIREAVFLFVVEEFEGHSSSYTRNFTEGEKIGLPEENVVQVSGKHNEYQVKFI